MISHLETGCSCSICAHDLNFDHDEFLIEQIAAGNCIIFAGAGVSTETAHAAPKTLYAELIREIAEDGSDLPFPDLAERYASRPDGRFELMKKIQDRFDCIKKFRDLRFYSTRFFSELATMPYFNSFPTTNWDRNFEELCAAKPFVYDPDMRFWEVPGRKVLKFHGTIDDYSSIIATRSDYKRCTASLQQSLIGAKLKEFLSVKTCIFSGLLIAR